jgi:hypothetical protein
MVHKIGGKCGVLDLGILQISGQLMHNGTDHFQVSQFLCTSKGGKKKPLPSGEFSKVL